MLSLRGKKIILQHATHPDDIATLLLTQRGFSGEHFHEDIIHDPRLLPDIDRACDRIFLAQKNNEKVMIFGDYDVDGISSTAALFLFLRDEMGMQVSYRLPHRVRDGYGIKRYHMDEIASTGTKLIITVDCGTKDIEALHRAQELGLEVIITDHHSCPEVLPDCVAVVNPRRKDSLYPFTGLSGSGVVWKVIHALLLKMKNEENEERCHGWHVEGRMNNGGLIKNSDNAPLIKGEIKGDLIERVKNPQLGTNNSVFETLRGPQTLERELLTLKNIDDTLCKYVDIVSLGTVADCMPMIDENRTIVRRGLRQAQISHHPFFQIFAGALNRPIVTEEDIGFFVGPLLNAGGRITTPYQSLAALLADSNEAYARIQELIGVNETRKGMSRDAYDRALLSIDPEDPILIFIDETLPHGILGLVAAKLTETFHRPSAVFTRDHDHFVGSLRAPEGINLVHILDATKSHLLRYGGHAGAAGCSIAVEEISRACAALRASALTAYDPDAFEPTLRVDSVIDLDQISHEMLASIESLRPFGPGCPAPIFMLRDITSIITPLGQTGEHVRWETSHSCEIIGFRIADYSSQLTSTPHHLIGTLKSRTWRDKKTLQFQVIDALDASLMVGSSDR